MARPATPEIRTTGALPQVAMADLPQLIQGTRATSMANTRSHGCFEARMKVRVLPKSGLASLTLGISTEPTLSRRLRSTQTIPIDFLSARSSCGERTVLNLQPLGK